MTKSIALDGDVDQGATPDLPKIDDHYRWAYEQAAHIRAGRFELVDILNVADEIEDVGKAEYRSLGSNIEIVLLHMLKWRFQAERRTRSWAGSIDEHRHRVLLDLEDNPSLKAKKPEAIARAYGLARYRAARATDLPLRTFPVECPYTWEHIMDAPYEIGPD